MKLFLTRKTILLLLLLLWCLVRTQAAGTGNVGGIILEKSTREPLMGATVQLSGTTTGAVTDLDGRFMIENIAPGTYEVTIKYVSLSTITLQNVEVVHDKTTAINAEMVEESVQLEGVVVVAQVRKNSDLALLQATKSALTIQSGISAQQIARTQDRDASEVIRRIPGISIIDGKFVMVRGLSQRYNNVWINNASVPSSEADVRAFNFDVIPSSQLDNVMIVKTPSPEIPADFSGGFIKIATKDVPQSNNFSFSVGGSWNANTHFRNFKENPTGSTDFLGFNGSWRRMPGGMKDRIDNSNIQQVDQLTKSGFNDKVWRVNDKNPVGDLRLNASMNRYYRLENGKQFALIGSINYTNSYNTLLNMENNRIGSYNATSDQPNYWYRYTDDVYSHNTRLGAMLNLTLISNADTRFEFKNIFNQLGQNKYSYRYGTQEVSGYYVQEKAEYNYNSRTTYNGQFTGTHTLSQNSKLDWNAGYAYTNKDQPDRHFIERDQNRNQNDPDYGKFMFDRNSASREFARLDEHILSAAANYSLDFNLGSIRPTLKAGILGEYRTRDYNVRFFDYTMSADVLQQVRYLDPVNEILTSQWLKAPGGVYVNEEADNRNCYSGNNQLGAAYAAINLPVGAFSAYAGVRFEANRMNIKTYTQTNTWKYEMYDYPSYDLFPSLNATYRFNERNQLRLGYGMSVNRPEFRELSSFAYRDFDLFSLVQGNKELKTCYVQNVDLRYELYPSKNELVSVALFYKNFRNPIEWTYTDAGGTYIYTFRNAEGANSYGAELDVKKSLDFIGLKDFSMNLNASYIFSRVQFPEGSMEKNRPMQGQSPYLVNIGVFYHNEKVGFSGSLLYNTIGKRIVNVGRDYQTGNVSNNIPDSYEMPRNAIDINLSQKFAKRWEAKLTVKDLLSEDVIYKQFPQFEDQNNITQTREVVQRRFNPGQTFYVSLNYSF